MADPVVTLELYRDALVDRRPREAFGLIHPEAREGLDARSFEVLFEAHADLLIAEAEAMLDKARSVPPTMRALVETPHGEVRLELTPRGWLLLHAPGTPPPR